MSPPKEIFIKELVRISEGSDGSVSIGLELSSEDVARLAQLFDEGARGLLVPMSEAKGVSAVLLLPACISVSMEEGFLVIRVGDLEDDDV